MLETKVFAVLESGKMANATTSTALTYEDLRKQARILENDIDMKLVAFSKLAAGLKAPITSATTSTVHKYKEKQRNNSTSDDSVPLLSTSGNSNDEDTFDSMSLEIEQQLQRLRSIGDQMQEQPVNGAAMLHTLRRHRDILADLTRDYMKTSRERQTRRDREELLGSNNTSSTRDGVNNRSSTYLKENVHLHNSDRLVSEQIAIAMETKEHLGGQRRTLKGIQTRFNDMSNRFPIINSLLQRINVRKRRDSIILGLVVSGCTVLLLLYAFH